MIIVRLMGGLGNQMFQYAFGRRLAVDRGVLLKLDLSWFPTQDKRKFELDKLNIKAEIARESEINKIRYFSKNQLLRKIYSIYQGRLDYYKRSFINEKNALEHDPNLTVAPRHCLLSGYWQSEKYFIKVAKFIQSEFTLSQPLSREAKELEKIICNTKNTVSVHVRRGDYISEKTNHWVCSVDYYEKAIRFIANEVYQPHFFFFSDDIDWVKKYLRIQHPATYIDNQNTHNDVEDLFLMSQCRHHINANSSFSWWGAWLGEKDGSIICTPSRWFENRPFPKDRVPERWLRL